MSRSSAMSRQNTYQNTETIDQAATLPRFVSFYNNEVLPLISFTPDKLRTRLKGLLEKFIPRKQQAHHQAIQCSQDFLDEVFPLAEASHHDVTLYYIYYQHLCAITASGKCMGLKNSAQFIDFNGSRENPNTILLKNHGLSVEIRIDSSTNIDSADKAAIEGIKIAVSINPARGGK